LALQTKGVNWHFRWRYLVRQFFSLVSLLSKNGNFKIIVFNVTLICASYSLSLVCVCNLQLTADVELLRYVIVSFLCFLMAKMLAGRFKWSKDLCEKFDFYKSVFHVRLDHNLFINI